ncbi:TcpE family conjugal transfer membrane protein, partial [Bacillus subtilis]|uniref:TcpE family conjugal transfer membrane protein n=1 Tax=Bacillus subtilis TaxID=1423 RepID=UPI003F7C7C74
MAYRTYKNVFRVRAELTSLSAGVGKKRIVLPEGWAITTDVVALFFISLPIFRFVIAPIPTIIINKIIGASNDQNLTIWAMAIIASFSLAIMLHKKDPAGKTSLQYMWSIIHFYLRNSWHDGWSTKRIS